MLVTALLQAHVIVAADPGQQRHLLPAQPAHPPAAAGIRKADVLRRDQLTPGPQVPPHLVFPRPGPPHGPPRPARPAPATTRNTRSLVPRPAVAEPGPITTSQ